MEIAFIHIRLDAHLTLIMKLGKINVFVGMDLRWLESIVFQFALMDINLILKITINALKSVLIIISGIINGKNVFHAQRTLFGIQTIMSADVMVDSRNIMESVFLNAHQEKKGMINMNVIAKKVFIELREFVEHVQNIVHMTIKRWTVFVMMDLRKMLIIIV